MIDVSQQQLSEAIFATMKEINRGAWLADRTGGASGGLGVDLPREVKIQCRVTAHPGEVIVESMQVAESGEKKSTGTENGTQTQTGDTKSQQGGGNSTKTINTWGEAL